MITATSRRCPACDTYLEGTEVTCPGCSRVLVPTHTEWPAGLKRLLMLYLLVDATITLKTEQEQWERLLTKAIRGRGYGQTLIRWAAVSMDCYPVAVQLLAEWERKGCPTDVTTLDTLRRRLAFAGAA